MLSSNSPTMLVADIGGTNTRFAIAEGDNLQIVAQRHFASADFSSLAQAVTAYLQQLPQQYALSGACLAVAGPVTGGQAQLTNLGWQVNEAELAHQLGMPVRLVNDFVAYAYSVPGLAAESLLEVKPGAALPDAPRLVLGPGTGFGTARLQVDGMGWQVTPCEAGHMTLAASSDTQLAVIDRLRQRLPVVNVESVLCGSGLVNLHQALADLAGRSAVWQQPAQITAAAASGDEIAQRCVAEFCGWLGAIAADLVLAHGARGGVCLGGGMLPKMVDGLLASDFSRAFVSKGLMSDYLQPVPVQLALKSDTALEGAAAYYRYYFA